MHFGSQTDTQTDREVDRYTDRQTGRERKVRKGGLGVMKSWKFKRRKKFTE